MTQASARVSLPALFFAILFSQIAGCGDSTSSGGGGSGGSPSDGGAPSSGGSPANGGTPNNGGSNTGGSGAGGCAELTIAPFKVEVVNEFYTVTSARVATLLGNPNEDDFVVIEFLFPSADRNGDETGTFDLSMGGDANYQSCSRCVLVLMDTTEEKQFFQSQGTMILDAESDQAGGVVIGSLADVTLVEVTIDEMTGVSTPVPGGECLHVATAVIDATVPEVPPGWMCDPAFYNNDSCDCGCGEFDEYDCASKDVSSCDQCDHVGSCSNTACPGNINPLNNAYCNF